MQQLYQSAVAYIILDVTIVHPYLFQPQSTDAHFAKTKLCHSVTFIHEQEYVLWNVVPVPLPR